MQSVKNAELFIRNTIYNRKQVLVFLIITLQEKKHKDEEKKN